MSWDSFVYVLNAYKTMYYNEDQLVKWYTVRFGAKGAEENAGGCK